MQQEGLAIFNYNIILFVRGIRKRSKCLFIDFGQVFSIKFMFFHFCTFQYWIYYSSRVAIEAALKEDFGEVTSSGSDSPVLLHTDSGTSRRKNTRRRILKSSSSGSDDENHRPSNPCESSVSYTSNTGLRCRPLTLTVTIDDVEETQSVFPSTSRPRRAVVRSAEERRERNRRLIERRQRRRQQPPLVILGADSSTDEDEGKFPVVFWFY